MNIDIASPASASGSDDNSPYFASLLKLIPWSFSVVNTNLASRKSYESVVFS